MDHLLTPVSTTYLKSNNEDEPLFTEVKPDRKDEPLSKPATVSSEDEALEVLKAQPDYDLLISTLKYLNRAHFLHTPGPKSAAIVQTLVTEIAHNYWVLFSEGSKDGDSRDLELFVASLRSVTGINALLSHLGALLRESGLVDREAKRPDITMHLAIFLDIIASALSGDDTILTIWAASTADLATESLKKVQSQALLSVLTSGRLVSVAGEAATLVDKDQLGTTTLWITDALEISRWIGRNVVRWVRVQSDRASLQFCSTLLQRAMSLGYPDSLIRLLTDLLLLSKDHRPGLFVSLCLGSAAQTRRTLYILLDYLASRHLDRIPPDAASSNPIVAAASGIIKSVIEADESRTQEVLRWCTSASGAGLGHGVAIRRAVLAALAQDKDAVTTVLEKSLTQFGDELYIRHAALMQQHVHAEVLLLSAGCVHRLSPIKLTMLLRSPTYLSTVSNRIAAPQVKARFLGMVVGEALSGLVDGKDKKLDFKMEEMDSEEAEFLKTLTHVADECGPVDAILNTEQDDAKALPTVPAHRPRELAKKKAKPIPDPISSTKPKAIIEEVDDSDSEDDEELKPYAKGSDPEDSDDDAELVQRNKPKAPVYVRDLITYLRDTDNYDKQKLALHTAPLLIRRKANYGTEISSHADELAGLLVGMQDKFELEGFDDLKLQGMIALVVAQPKSMAPWFARTFFEGDFSLSQRTVILVTLGLSARELAGFQKSEYQDQASFASKRLPEKMEKLYIDWQKENGRVADSNLKALPSTALDTITKSLTSTFLEPIAAEAADTATGPDALKLQTFTSRYKSKASRKPRVRAIPNTTAALLATSFFSPLTAHFQVALRSPRPIVLNPALLGLYLQTLGVIVHAAGPSTLSLPELTSELWDLLLGVRQHVVGELAALKGWFVAMASLLEVNEGDMRRLCQTQGREVVETREWVSGVFERTRGEDGGEENEVKMLAAGTLIRLGEAIEKYQALLMGDMIGF